MWIFTQGDDILNTQYVRMIAAMSKNAIKSERIKPYIKKEYVVVAIDSGFREVVIRSFDTMQEAKEYVIDIKFKMDK